MSFPLVIGVFASGSGGNLLTCLRFEKRRPDLLKVALVFSEMAGTAAIQIARDAGIPVLTRNFAQEVGIASECTSTRDLTRYQQRAIEFHNAVFASIRHWENDRHPLDALVFSYRKWVHGKLLDEYAGRIVNQHPGDLTILDGRGARVLVGNDPVLSALREGLPSVRTSTFLVDTGHDTGSIICQGPRVPTCGYSADRVGATRLEAQQKIESDRPSLVCALAILATQSMRIGSDQYVDGSRVVHLGQSRLPFGGIDTETIVRNTNGIDGDTRNMICAQLQADMEHVNRRSL